MTHQIWCSWSSYRNQYVHQSWDLQAAQLSLRSEVILIHIAWYTNLPKCNVWFHIAKHCRVHSRNNNLHNIGQSFLIILRINFEEVLDQYLTIKDIESWYIRLYSLVYLGTGESCAINISLDSHSIASSYWFTHHSLVPHHPVVATRIISDVWFLLRSCNPCVWIILGDCLYKRPWLVYLGSLSYLMLFVYSIL